MKGFHAAVCPLLIVMGLKRREKREEKQQNQRNKERRLEKFEVKFERKKIYKIFET